MVSPLVIFIFTKVASTFTLVVSLLLTFSLLLKFSTKQMSISLLASTALLFITVTTAKEYFQVARPANALVAAPGYAFPSGHAAGVVFLAIVVSFLSWSLGSHFRYSILAVSVLTAGAVSYSRIALNVHTWFQVFAGICIGAICGFLFIYLGTRS
jgi:membrane-associated phospholipid phosphatase